MKSFRAPGSTPSRRAYSSGIQVGQWCHVSGHVPVDSRGGCQGEDAYEQATVVLENIERTLSAVGAGRHTIVSTSVFLTDITDIDEIDRAYRAFFDGQELPARTTVEISALGRPEFRVEISAIAHKPDADDADLSG